ncbi:uncharacterized protein LOC131152755 [Malania oleifera]|uniref:uncharacterized protein LOC131152755 n=1 Tax=Malania oleifera TaxID=397392 RepID=UPI0025AE716B|nr:uncharacterized protein LOC131152755 [Malania oleifera]
MGIWLYDVLNLSGKPLNLNNSSNNWRLNNVTNTIDRVTGYQSNSWYFSSDYPNVNIQVYDAGSWRLTIDVTYKTTSSTLSATWGITRNYTRFNFIFQDTVIWFYSSNHALTLDGRQQQGWYLDVNEQNLKWEPYNVAS